MSALLLVAALLMGGPTPDAKPAFDPFKVVGVCPVASGGRPWSVCWRRLDESSEITAMCTRVLKNLESTSVGACLVLMIESDPTARKAVLALVEDSMTYRKADTAVRAVWTKHGVDAAVHEVATTGQRGPAVERMLASCEKLRAQEGR